MRVRAARMCRGRCALYRLGVAYAIYVSVAERSPILIFFIQKMNISKCQQCVGPLTKVEFMPVIYCEISSAEEKRFFNSKKKAMYDFVHDEAVFDQMLTALVPCLTKYQLDCINSCIKLRLKHYNGTFWLCVPAGLT